MDDDIRVVFQSTVDSCWPGIPGEDDIKRLLGCAILLAMPAEGIEEALLSLTEIFDYNLASGFLALPQPPKQISSTGTVVARSERPELVIAE